MANNIKNKSIMKFTNNAFIASLYADLLKYGRVKVTGLGVFQLKKVKSRGGYDMQTQKKITLPEHTRISFKPTLSLKNIASQWKK